MTSWLAQPGVTAICATPEPSSDPTATPAPSETFAPTEQRIFVETDLGLRLAVENAENDRNIVLTDDVALTETLKFPYGRTGLALRGGKEGEVGTWGGGDRDGGGGPIAMDATALLLGGSGCMTSVTVNGAA